MPFPFPGLIHWKATTPLVVRQRFFHTPVLYDCVLWSPSSVDVSENTQKVPATLPSVSHACWGRLVSNTFVAAYRSEWQSARGRGRERYRRRGDVKGFRPRRRVLYSIHRKCLVVFLVVMNLYFCSMMSIPSQREQTGNEQNLSSSALSYSFSFFFMTHIKT